MKNILLLGATGSIGDSVLSVIKQNSDKLNLTAISFQSNLTKALSIIEEFDPNYVYCESKANLSSINDSLERSEGIELFSEKSELEYLLKHKSIDIIISAISGFSGLETTFMAVQTGKIILLANKESIVVAGDIILPLAKKHNTKIIPIDSEHNAIFQCLNSEKNTNDVTKIIITASGGPFLNQKIDDLSKVTKNEALNHPNWKMGSKITIDSATLVNKCLELIEAKYLFDLNEEYFELVVHPQSIIHSIVTYKDGSSICQMSNPDMRVPISHALSLEESRLSLDFTKINFSSLNLTFQEFPEDRLEIANLAREVCNTGGSSGTAFNAANEIAVENFLNGKITFNKIYEVIYRTFNAVPVSNSINIEAIYEIDKQTRMEAKKVVKSLT
ncbi:1-deoxy-D-xylulose-5-phosphate reductoisomerase [Gammaproteobacteria bacterium]|nr:1-deoxy-D-xylulose-5-phosphate reductoisomerase [Gammaproteobacteria bacterium]